MGKIEEAVKPLALGAALKTGTELYDLEYKKEGLVTGIGMNIFKLAGSVILYGVVSAFFVALIRLIIGVV